jgi:hypothetical protein
MIHLADFGLIWLDLSFQLSIANRSGCRAILCPALTPDEVKSRFQDAMNEVRASLKDDAIALGIKGERARAACASVHETQVPALLSPSTSAP